MWSREFIVLWFSMFVAMIGIAMVSPLLPVIVRDELGGPEIAVALSFSGLAVSMMIFSPIVGRFGDHIGSKPFIVAGFFIYAVGASGYLVATSWEQVVAFRVLSGIGAASIFPMTLAYVGRLSPPGKEGAYVGAFAVSEVLGFGIGPLVGGVIHDTISSDAVFATMALLLVTTALATFLLLPPGPSDSHDSPEASTAKTTPSWRKLLHFAPVQAALTVHIVVALGWGAGATFLAVYVISEDGLGTESATFVGVLLASRSLIGGVLQPYFGRLADRMSRLMLVMVGLLVSATGHLLIPDLPNTLIEISGFVVAPWLLTAFVIIGLAEAVAWPAQQAIFVDIGRRVGMGSVMGLNQMGSSLGFLAGSLIGAAVVEFWGLEAVFRYTGVIVFVGAILFFILMRRASSDMAEIRNARQAAEKITSAH
jgi:DHA1 family multidrug resistance protein-like MFS transporter